MPRRKPSDPFTTANSNLVRLTESRTYRMKDGIPGVLRIEVAGPVGDKTRLVALIHQIFYDADSRLRGVYYEAREIAELRERKALEYFASLFVDDEASLFPDSPVAGLHDAIPPVESDTDFEDGHPEFLSAEQKPTGVGDDPENDQPKRKPRLKS